VIGPETDILFADAHLMETSRTRWQYGEWDDLAAIAPEVIARHPDRARLALLVAAAKSHKGEVAEARTLLQAARDWGCNRRLVARVMASMVHNSLGRVAAALDDAAVAGSHFGTALTLVEPRSDPALLARTRQVRETARMGLLPDAAKLVGADLKAADGMGAAGAAELGRLAGSVRLLSAMLESGEGAAFAAAPGDVQDRLRGSASRMTGDIPQAAWDTDRNERFSAEAMAAIRGAAGLLHIEVKSIPRSGLHYFEAQLAGRLGAALRFCEWYHEPGCCRRMPCALAPSMAPRKAGDGVRVRLVKSHDFDLGDPVYPQEDRLRRFVLVRDLRFVLTSWWCLDLLSMHRLALIRAGINPVSVFYRHDAAIVAAAYRVLDTEDIRDGEAAITAWLAKRTPYLLGFARKWAGSTADGADRAATVVRYDQIDRAIAELGPALTEPGGRSHPPPQDGPARAFAPRSSPFEGPTERLSATLHRRQVLFAEAAADLVAADETGLFRWAEQDP
jgi:hypothetical protein